MASKKLRIGIIGAGKIANAHVDRLKKLDNAIVVAAADVSEECRKKATDEWGCEAVFDDWGKMLESVELDAVSICTPNALHYQPCLDALNAGCHVMIEKPLAMNSAEGAEMVALAKEKGLQCSIAFQFRYRPETQMIRRAVEAGSLGDIMVARVHAMRRRGIPSWGVFGRKELQGGGPLIDIGVHAMEMAHYAMGFPKPVAASGKVWTYLGDSPSQICGKTWDYKTYTVEDLAVGMIRFENGAVMMVESSFAAHIGPDDENLRFELMGTKGGANYSPAALYFDRDGTMFNATPGFMPQVDVFQVKMANWVDTCLGKMEDQSPADHGLMIQKMIDGIYESSEKGREVAIS